MTRVPALAVHKREGEAAMIIRAKGLVYNSDTAEWRISPLSGGNSDNCVQIAFIEGGVAVGDSQNPDGPVILYTNKEWAAFIGGVLDHGFGVKPV